MKTRFECNECGHRFNKTVFAGTFEVQCPNCKGYDTEAIGIMGLA